MVLLSLGTIFTVDYPSSFFIQLKNNYNHVHRLMTHIKWRWHVYSHIKKLLEVKYWINNHIHWYITRNWGNSLPSSSFFWGGVGGWFMCYLI